MPTEKNVKDSREHNVNYRWYTRIMDRYRASSLVIPGANAMIRRVLAMRFARDKKAVENYLAGENMKCDGWLENANLFFGFSCYRSGTVFLTNILKTEFPNWHIEHEANVDDYWNYAKVMRDEAEALKYFKEFRKGEICFRVKDFQRLDGYGEINPFLRLHAGAVKGTFPQAKLFHVVRDGRDVVRSIMSREILTRKDPMSKLIRPPAGNPYAAKWKQMDRFEKVCWQWQFDNASIRKHVGHRVEFEKFRADYDYFRVAVLDYLGLHLEKADWEKYTTSPKNITPKYAIPKWQDWTTQKKESFERICGDEMKALGYSLNW